MPSNQKAFSNVNRDALSVLRSNLRSQGYILPMSDSGYLRGRGVFADVNFDEKTSTLSFRIREIGKGETHASILGNIETQVRKINRGESQTNTGGK